MAYIRQCLRRERQIPDRREKAINWSAFEALMFASWLRVFDCEDPDAEPVAELWAEFVRWSLVDGVFDGDAYEATYRQRIPKLDRNERVIWPAQFYVVNLVRGLLDESTDRRFVSHLLGNPSGMLYVYDEQISVRPAEFASLRTSRWLAALEQIAGYASAPALLARDLRWIAQNQGPDGVWDLGPRSRDGVYFPLSDSWRDPADRKRDCTARIRALFARLAR